MKIVKYSSLNKKNKARIDIATKHYDTRPKTAHHATISSRSIKYTRSMITVTNPETEINMLLGNGRMKITQILLDR